MNKAVVVLALVAACCPKREPVEPRPPEPEVLAPVDRSGLPPPGPARDWAPPAIASWTLPNGIAVWHLERKGAPLISLKLVLPNGAATDPDDKAGLTGLTADMLDEGAGAHDALELGEALQRLATDYGASASTDGVMLSMHMLADNLAPSLALLSDIVQRPHLSDTEFDRRKGLWVAQAISHEADPNDARTNVIRHVLHGDGYGGWSGNGTKTTLARIEAADVKQQYQAVFKPQGASFVVVGDVSRDAIDGALKQAFGGWSGTPSAKDQERVLPKLPSNAVYRVDFPGATQSSIALARRADGAHATDYFPAMIYNFALGESFSSRLNLNLREDKGYTYGARANFWRWRHGGVYALSAQVKRETTRASVDEMIHELDAMGGDEPLSATEHREAIDGLLLGFVGRFEHIGGVAGELSSMVMLGKPSDWLSTWPEQVRAVSLAQADESAKRHVTVADFAVVVCGDMKEVAPSLAGLDRPIYDCDPEGICKAAP
jgi:zinc protease